MYCHSTLKNLNCSHNLDKYYEGKFVKDDYCDNCLDEIAEIESESIRQETSELDIFRNTTRY